MASEAFVFYPVIFGVIRSPPLQNEENSHPSDRVVMINPLFLTSELNFPSLISSIRVMLDPDVIPEGPPPASKASVESLRTVNCTDVEAGKRETEECSVCLDRLWNSNQSPSENCEVVKEMPCGHKFHGGCIEKWLNLHGVCPLCRYRMPEEKGGKKLREEAERGDQAGLAVPWNLNLYSFLRPQHQRRTPIIEDVD